MIFSFVIPELLLAVALFLLVTQALTFIGLGTEAEVAGLVVWNISWPAIIVRARLVSIGHSYEEAATDLGASRLGAIRRVLLPMLMPAIFASAVLVFAEHRRRLRDRRAAVVDRRDAADVSADLRERPRRAERPGAQRPATIMLAFSLGAALLGSLRTAG